MAAKKSVEKKNEVAMTEGYAVLGNREFLEDAMADDCQGLEFSLDRIKIPAGGGTMFEIPSADGDEPEMVKELTGVIVYNHPSFAMYRSKYTGGNNPPDCGSFDGVTGVGTPGGKCALCPYNKFGSGEGQGKLCKNKRMIYILREGEMFPLVLSLPAGSLKPFTNYVKAQLTRGRKLSRVVTRISLKKATNASGIAYSQAVFSFDRALSPDECSAIAEVTDMVKAYVANLTPASIVEDELPFDSETGEVIEPLA